MLSAVKDILTKEVNVKEFLEMEIELTKLKELLATEIKLKEFLVQEIDLKKLLTMDSGDQQLHDRRIHNRRKDDGDEETISHGKDNENQAQDDEALSEIIQLPAIKQLPAYDYALIDSMQEENEANRFVFNELMRFAEAKDYSKVAGRLEIFNSQIRDHYHRADISLYAYLKTYIHIKFPKREKAFTQLSLEMKNISIEIFYTISQSPNLPLSDKTHSAFMKEFNHLGELMNERIHREESVLFTMYEQTHTAKSICD